MIQTQANGAGVLAQDSAAPLAGGPVDRDMAVLIDTQWDRHRRAQGRPVATDDEGVLAGREDRAAKRPARGAVLPANVGRPGATGQTELPAFQRLAIQVGGSPNRSEPLPQVDVESHRLSRWHGQFFHEQCAIDRPGEAPLQALQIITVVKNRAGPFTRLTRLTRLNRLFRG